MYLKIVMEIATTVYASNVPIESILTSCVSSNRPDINPIKF